MKPIWVIVSVLLMIPLAGCRMPSSGPVVDRFAASVVQENVAGYFEFGPTARSTGAFLMPRQHVAIATIDDDPLSTLAVQRRIQVIFVDVNRSRDTFGEVVDSSTHAYVAEPTKSLRGIAATSFRDDDGSVDALFVSTSGAPNRILATTIDGAVTPDGILGTTEIGGISASQLTPSVIPALESGMFEGETKILMAYAAPTSFGHGIHVGFLTRTGPDTWHFHRRLVLPASDPPGELCAPAYQVAAAFDSTRQEFTVAWECGSFTAYARRISWDGETVGPLFAAHQGLEALHSGVTLAYNQVRDHYLFTFQHNSALLTPNAAGSFDCVSDRAVGCVTTLPGCIELGGIWAGEVDYEPGFEFRVGGASFSAEGAGHNYRLVAGRTETRCSDVHTPPHDWLLESELWPSRSNSEVHKFVRCPDSGVTVVIHSRSVPETKFGALRYTFIDEPSTIPFDQ